MFFSTRQRKLKKIILEFQNSFSTSIILDISQKEIDWLCRKKQFKNLIFVCNPDQPGELKTYTILKQ